MSLHQVVAILDRICENLAMRANQHFTCRVYSSMQWLDPLLAVLLLTSQ